MTIYGGPDIVTDALVLHLDAGNSKSYPGSGTTWNDLSGNNRNGTLTNGPTYSSSNKGNIIFDGTNDYINLPSSVSSINSLNMTVGCWVNQTVLNTSSAFSDIRNIAQIGTGEIGSSSCFYLHLRTSQVTFRYQAATGSAQLSPSINQDTNIWHYYTGVSNTTSISLYRDGILVGSTPYTINFNTLSSSNMYLGLCNTGAGNYFNGKIASAQVYNKALSATEVLQNYNAIKGRFGL